MGWTRMDDGYMDHPKILEAGAMAELLDRRAIEFCAKHETDGAIPRAALSVLGREIPAAKKHVAKLIEVGRWKESAKGWVVHDYLDFNPSKAERADMRASTARRVGLHRNRTLRQAIKDRDQGMCRYCGEVVAWSDRKGALGATYDHIDPKGENSMDNLVVCCRGCNAKKRDRTLEQAGMKLLPEPRTYLDTKSRYVGSGRESVSSSAPKIVERCRRCDRLQLDCDCPPLELVENGG